MKHEIFGLFAGLALIIGLALFAQYFPDMTLQEAILSLFVVK